MSAKLLHGYRPTNENLSAAILLRLDWKELISATLREIFLPLIPRFKHAILVIATATTYGIAMEAGQHFLSHRSPFLVTDVLVNTLGASTVLVWFLARPYLELRPITEYVKSNS